MAKRAPAVIDIKLPELMQKLRMQPTNQDFAMVDTEPTVYTGGGIVFDFAYGFVNPFKGTSTAPKGKLIYESIKDVRIINEIQHWSKIKDAANDSLYGFHKLLTDKNWYAETLSRVDLDEEARNIQRNEIQHKWERQLFAIRRIDWHSVQWWDPHPTGRRGGYTMGTGSKKRYEDALERLDKAKKVEKELHHYLKTESNLKSMLKSGILDKNIRLGNIKQRLYSEIYRDEKIKISGPDVANDFKLFRELEISHNIGRWKNVLTTFKKDLDKSNLLAITAFNIAADMRFIKNTSRQYDTPEFENILYDYTNICMMNFYKRLETIEGDLIYNMLHEFNPNAILEGYAEATKNVGTMKNISFEVLYKHLFDAGDYKETHTARGDTADSMKALTKVIQDNILPHLERR